MSRRDHLAEPCLARGKSPLSASMRHSVPLVEHRHYTGMHGADSEAAPPAPLTQVPLGVTYTYTKSTNFTGAKGVRERNQSVAALLTFSSGWIQLCGKIWLETSVRSNGRPWTLPHNDLAPSLICYSDTFCHYTCILITIFLAMSPDQTVPYIIYSCNKFVGKDFTWQASCHAPTCQSTTAFSDTQTAALAFSSHRLTVDDLHTMQIVRR